MAVQAPLSGEQAALGEHIKLGAQLAVEEASKAFKALGYDLVLVPYDDQAKPEVGVANARNIVSDPNILVMVGHFNSGVALPASEVYKDAMLAMISPANTATEITDRGYPNVNRVCGRDDVQGPVGARFAAQDLKLKSVYIIHDKTLYGQGVADNFRSEAKKLGMNVMGYEGTEERANFSPMIIPLKLKTLSLSISAASTTKVVCCSAVARKRRQSHFMGRTSSTRMNGTNVVRPGEATTPASRGRGAPPRPLLSRRN